MRASFDYAGSTVFVAGGTSGINLGIARAFAAAGARIGRCQPQPGEGRRRRRRSSAPGALGYAFDVRDAEAVSDALAAFAAEAGPIDVLVSGAAGNFPAAAKDLSPNGFKAVVDIDLLGTFHVMRAAYPHMRRPGGSIINISAPQAPIPMAMQIHVCAAKAGVDMVTRCLAIEWGPEGLRVNGVVPGPIDGTEGMARLAPTEAIRAADRRLGADAALRQRRRTSPTPACGSARPPPPTSAAASSSPTAAGPSAAHRSADGRPRSRIRDGFLRTRDPPRDPRGHQPARRLRAPQPLRDRHRAPRGGAPRGRRLARRPHGSARRDRRLRARCSSSASRPTASRRSSRPSTATAAASTRRASIPPTTS